MTERALDKRKIVGALVQSTHGELKAYLEAGTEAAQADPDFLAHVIAWNHHKGQIRDSKVALPVIALKAAALGSDVGRVVADNALAHLADLKPREFVRAVQFAWDIDAPSNVVQRLMRRYVNDLEADQHDWERTAIIHREALRWLYAQAGYTPRVPGGESSLYGRYRHIKNASEFAMKADRGLALPRFRVMATLPTLTPVEIGGAIDRYKLPFLQVRGALGVKAKEPDVVLALMKRMSTTELVTNMKWLERVGVKTIPALRSALELALGQAGTAKRQRKGAVLKTAKAAEVLADDEKLSGKLHVLQEQQISHVKGIEGTWVVLADKSGSMEAAMEAARLVAGTLTRLVKGQVHLIFFDTTPRHLDATGKTLEELTAITKTYVAEGGTSIGCGLQYLLDKKIKVDGIAIVSDGCENDDGFRSGRPHFGPTYTEYVRRLGIDPPTVYWYRTAVKVLASSIESVMRSHRITRAQAIEALRQSAITEVAGFQRKVQVAGIDLQTFDLSTGNIDYFSVLNLVPTMKAQRYALLDEIYGMKLRTLDEVLDRTKGRAVLPQLQEVTA